MRSQVAEVRRFSRTVTQRVGALNEHFASRNRPLAVSRLLWEIGTEGGEVVMLRSRLDVDSGPFRDTAAVLTCLDLFVTSDTAVAHLAGALGKPVWVALPLVADWRWLLDREDSPWYPSMRLFRQTERGDWHGVFRRMAAEVRKPPS